MWHRKNQRNLNSDGKKQSTDTNKMTPRCWNYMTDIRKAIIKMFEKAIVSTLETNGKIKLKNIITEIKKLTGWAYFVFNVMYLILSVYNLFINNGCF